MTPDKMSAIRPGGSWTVIPPDIDRLRIRAAIIEHLLRSTKSHTIHADDLRFRTEDLIRQADKLMGWIDGTPQVIFNDPGASVSFAPPSAIADAILDARSATPDAAYNGVRKP